MQQVSKLRCLYFFQSRLAFAALLCCQVCFQSYLHGFGCQHINVSAAVSDKVKEGKAHGVEMCGEKLVLFRGKDGKVSCLFIFTLYKATRQDMHISLGQAQ